MLLLAVGRNYKQLSYMASVAIIATVIALAVLLADSFVAILSQLHVGANYSNNEAN